MTNYKSDIIMGERYRDTQTGIEGVATAVTFHQFGCERVMIEAVVAGKIEEYGFDAPRLTHAGTGARAELRGTGGPGKADVSVRRTAGGRGGV